MKAVADRPVGIFDSGLGGLSIVKEVRKRLPRENILFLADHANGPYGDKPVEEILSLTRIAVPMLVAEGAKAVVIACNTASVSIIDEFRERYPDTSFIAVVPAIKPAAAHSKNGIIVVFATNTTLASAAYSKIKQEHAGDKKVFDIPCPEWAPMVESGTIKLAALEAPVREALATEADTIVLGCTHYPFLRDAIRELVREARLIDSGESVAARLESVLAKVDRLRNEGEGDIRYLTSGDSLRASFVGRKLTGWDIQFRTVGH